MSLSSRDTDTTEEGPMKATSGKQTWNYGLSPSEQRSIIPQGTIIAGWRGSMAHGTYTPSYGPNAHDDIDILGAMIAPETVYLGLDRFEQHEFMQVCSDGIVWDSVVYELRKFVSLLLKGNPNVMSLLWLPEEMYLLVSETGRKLIAMRDLFLSLRVYHSFVGYAHGQLKKMERPGGKHKSAARQGLFDKFGYDTKNASHCIRILRMGVGILQTGQVKVVRPDAVELVAIKNGEWSIEQVKAEADRWFMIAKQSLHQNPCKLPEHPDTERVNLALSSMLLHVLKGYTDDPAIPISMARAREANEGTKHHPGCFPDGDDTSACHPDCKVRKQAEGKETSDAICIGIFNDFDIHEIASQPTSIRRAWEVGRNLSRVEQEARIV